MKDEVSRYANKFKCVQTKLFQINKSLQGQSTFVPIAFDREYTSLCMATIHSSVIDFKFSSALQGNSRVILHNSEDEEDEEEKSTHAYLENGILVEKKHKPEEQEGEEGAAKSSPNKKKRRGARRKWNPNNMAEYFFFNDQG